MSDNVSITGQLNQEYADTPIFTYEVNKLDHGGKKQKVTLVVGGIHVFLLGKSRFSTKKKMISMFKYAEISKMEIKSDTEFVISTTSQINIQSPESNTISRTIMDQAHRILTKYEFKMIEQIPPNKGLSKSNFFSFRYRLNYQLLHLPQKIYFDAILHLKNLKHKNGNMFQLSNLPNQEDVMIQFLSLLSLRSGIDKIEISSVVGMNIYQVLSHNFDFNSRVTHIAFRAHINDFFYYFLEKYSRVEKSMLSSFSFIDMQLTQPQLKSVFSVVNKDRIKSLTFDNCINQELMDYMTNLDSFTQLENLVIKSSRLFDFTSFFPKLCGLTSLSLTNMSLEVSDILSIIAQHELNQLTHLNVSGNKSLIASDQIIVLPPNLECIFADSMNWRCDSIVQLLSVCSSHQIPMKGSFSHAKIIGDNWDLVFQTLSNLPMCSFSHLKWDGNPVDPSLFFFLKKSPSLSYLSVSGCHSTSMSQDLCTFLQHNTIIKTLKVRGTNDVVITELGPLISMLPYCTSLTDLDISFQHIGLSELKHLAENAVKCPSLTFLNFQGTSIASSDSIIDVLSIFETNNKKIEIIHPESDFERLHRINQMTDDTEERIREKIFNLSPRFIKSTHPFDKPYPIQEQQFDFVFPLVAPKTKRQFNTQSIKPISTVFLAQKGSDAFSTKSISLPLSIPTPSIPETRVHHGPSASSPIIKSPLIPQDVDKTIDWSFLYDSIPHPDNSSFLSENENEFSLPKMIKQLSLS